MSRPKISERQRILPVACPFFMPAEKFENGAWPHPARLPLACGWSGTCTAPGHEGQLPSAEELREFCNLGYAEGCSRLPPDREWDAVRFAVISPRARDTAADDATRGSRIHLRYVCERRHRPAEHGTLEFNLSESLWILRHPDRRVQHMAECFLTEYLNKNRRQNAEPAGELIPLSRDISLAKSVAGKEL
jgi:hypothetical protein